MHRMPARSRCSRPQPLLSLIVLAGLPAYIPPVESLHCSHSRSPASTVLQSLGQGREMVQEGRNFREQGSQAERAMGTDVVLGGCLSQRVEGGVGGLFLRGGGTPGESSKRIAQDTMKL